MVPNEFRNRGFKTKKSNQHDFDIKHCEMKFYPGRILSF